MARPIQPSIRREMAEYLALSDGTARCGSELHQRIVKDGVTCPVCLLHLRDYVAVMPTEWPEP